MNYKLIYVLLSFLIGLSLRSQEISNDPSVLYMKANVLYDQGRYDEAVRMYNLILKEDDNHANALYMRAKAKYELGAYKGTLLDGQRFMEKHGMTKEFIKILGLAEFQLGNVVASYNYAKVAVELDPYDADMLFLLGESALDYTNQNEACEAYARAAILGSSKAKRVADQVCGGISKWLESGNLKLENGDENESEKEGEESEISDKEKEAEISTQEPEPQIIDDGEITLRDILTIEEDDDEETENNKTKEPQPTNENEEIAEREAKKTDPIDNEATQDIVIDEKLSLTISNGLGDRKVEEQPPIFMLSDQDGVVVIDVCVSRTGRVTDASFNRGESTIVRSSMTSLALRKAKEFVFETSAMTEQCGTIVYNIKA